jgi:hypothetical protein
LPATPASVSSFLAAQAHQGLRPATIARRCAAIRHFHRLAGVDPVPSDAAVVKTTMKGLRRSLGTAQAKKAPATATIAKRMVDVMPGDTLKGRLDPRHGHPGLCRGVSEVRGGRFERRGRGVLRRGRAHHDTPVEDRSARQRADYRDPAGRWARSVRCGCCASGSTSGIIEGALFRQTPKDGKGIGERITGRLITTS